MLPSREVQVGSEVIDVDVLRLWRTGAWQGDACYVGREGDVGLSGSALQTVEHSRGATEVQLNVGLSLRSLPGPGGGSRERGLVVGLDTVVEVGSLLVTSNIVQVQELYLREWSNNLVKYV